MRALWAWFVCRLLERHTPFEKTSEPKEIGLNEWYVEKSGVCRRCGCWRRRRVRVPAPPCDHRFPHVCDAPECRAQAEEIWSKAGSVRSVRGEGEEPGEDALIDLESGVPR